MKIIKKNLADSFVFSKMYLTDSTSYIDSSHYPSLLGSREPFFSVLHPFSIKQTLKSSLIALENFLFLKYNIIFVANIEDKVLFQKFF